jgi:DNA polymerase-3 subunit delta'
MTFLYNGCGFVSAIKGLEVLTFVDQFAKMGRENQKNFLRYGISFIRECCLLMAGAGNLVHLPAKELDTAQKMTNVVDISKAQAYKYRA